MENINFSRARKSLKPYVGDVEAAAVPCGLGRAIGNKVHDKIVVHAFITPHPPIEISFCNGMILSPFGDICMSYVGRNFKDGYISKVYGKRILMYCLILCFMFCFMFKSCSSVLLFVR